MKPDITIYDIADALKLAPVTISRALNNHPAVREKTRQRVLAYAKEHGYRANSFASNLRRQKTNTIGILMQEVSNSYFITSVLSGVEMVLTEAGYDLIIAHSSESAQKEIANANNLFHKRVDGLIVSLAYDTDSMSHFEPYLQKNIPVVFYDRVEASFPGTKVIIDNERAGYDATRHLIEQGCTNIVHVTASLKRNVYALRLAGYEKALQENGIPLRKENLILVDYINEDAGQEVANQILAMQPMPDGIFITNDFCAAICIRALTDAGVRIPEDIAVVGFNNDIISKVVAPRLTTINYPGRLVGEEAARQLLKQLQGNKQDDDKTIIIESNLITRDSSLRHTNNE
jgi:LacI family transcriptional regulator